MNSVVELLQALIRIPSVNPDGDPGTDGVGEGDCARWVAAFLRDCGAEVTLEEVYPDRPNVIARFRREVENVGPRLLLAPHLDTVSVAGMTIDPFGGEIRDGRVWGRGASDTKGTMAAMLWALREMAGVIPTLRASVGFAAMMGEETGQPGSRHFVRHHADEFDFAVVGEPTELETVHAHKGCFWVEITVRGRAAHGSTPERGENAIFKLNRLIDDVWEDLQRELGRFTDPALGPPTVNLGMIRGGTRTNIVPDTAMAAFDFRETPALRQSGGARGLLRNLLQEKGWSGHFEEKVTVDATPLFTPPDHPEILRLQGLGSRLATAPWFCDAGWLAAGGIPAVACGPGNIAQAHTRDEHIEITKLEEGARFYRRLLESLKN